MNPNEAKKKLKEAGTELHPSLKRNYDLFVSDYERKLLMKFRTNEDLLKIVASASEYEKKKKTEQEIFESKKIGCRITWEELQKTKIYNR